MKRLKNVAIFLEILWTWLWNSATTLEIVRKIRFKSFRSSEFILSNKLENRFYGHFFWPTRYWIKDKNGEIMYVGKTAVIIPQNFCEMLGALVHLSEITKA